MSEYQYYEFRAIDRPLSESEMAQLGRISPRAEITSTSFVNVYHHGDFRGDPYKAMDRYFDAFLYVSNWGTRRLMFRLPRRLVDVPAWRAYGRGESLILKFRKHHVLVELCSEDDELGGWEEGEGWLDALVGLRDELLSGDCRCLMLGWLLGLQHGQYPAELQLPPLPPGLGDLSDPLRALADFLRIDYGLIEAAGRLGGGMAPPPPSPQDYAGWIARVPEADKNRLLLQLLGGDAMHVRSELVQRFHETRAEFRELPVTADRATVRQLLDEAACPK